MKTLFRRQILCSACLLLVAASAIVVRSDDKATSDSGVFFAVEGAKDCALDESRQRLYVTTPAKLVVLDVKQRSTVESIDLLGDLQACDIARDCSYLAVGPLKAQHLYWIKLGDELDINQVQFKAPAIESGVWSLCIGSDNTVLFSMTFNGSGHVGLRRFKPADQSVAIVGNVQMDAAISPSGDRQFAAIAEGNISSGPLKIYDFKNQQLKLVANLERFHYEIACAPGARYFASPTPKGCDLFNEIGGRLGNLEGKAVIAAAFHPKSDSLFVMRHDESKIQEYDIEGRAIANDYLLDGAAKIKGKVNDRVVANVQSVGPQASVSFRRMANVIYKGFQSGRLKVSDSGEHLMAVVPTGVYLFKTKPRSTPADGAPKSRIKVINAR